MANPPRDKLGPLRGSFTPREVDGMEVWEVARILGVEDSSGEDMLMARWDAHRDGRAAPDWDEV